MRSPRQIGITGGIGAGKSLVSRIFKALGAPVYDADSRAKSIMTTDGILINQIKKEFGVLSYFEDGSLNRPQISQQVFDNPERLDVLNSLVHPRVQDDYNNWVNGQRDQPYILKEAALLIEANSYLLLDKIIVVSAPEALRIKRVLLRDEHRSAEQIKSIISHQMAEEEKLQHADFIINNDETVLLIPQVLTLHQTFIS